MKKNISLIILVIILIFISSFLTYIVVSKQHLNKQTFNIKEGDIIEFDDFATKVTVLNVASLFCNNDIKCSNDDEVEVSLKVEYNGEITNYTLKSSSNPRERIKNSNNYLILKYENNKIEIIIKDRRDI